MKPLAVFIFAVFAALAASPGFADVAVEFNSGEIAEHYECTVQALHYSELTEQRMLCASVAALDISDRQFDRAVQKASTAGKIRCMNNDGEMFDCPVVAAHDYAWNLDETLDDLRNELSAAYQKTLVRNLAPAVFFLFVIALCIVIVQFFIKGIFGFFGFFLFLAGRIFQVDKTCVACRKTIDFDATKCFYCMEYQSVIADDKEQDGDDADEKANKKAGDDSQKATV